MLLNLIIAFNLACVSILWIRGLVHSDKPLGFLGPLYDKYIGNDLLKMAWFYCPGCLSVQLGILNAFVFGADFITAIYAYIITSIIDKIISC